MEKIRTKHMEHPCRIYRGAMAYDGTAVSVDLDSVLLFLPMEQSESLPDLGEEVRLELSLPGDAAAARCLTAKARVRRVRVRADGSSETELRFRRAAFADQNSKGRRWEESVPAGWAM